MAVKALPVARAPHADVWHGIYGAPLALLLVLLPFAAALVWALAARPVADEAQIGRSVAQTADVVRDHSATMQRIGDRIVTAARASESPERARWIAYGEHLVSDAQGLAALEARLRSAATAAEADPIHNSNMSVAAAIDQARWEQVRADGRATSLHGRVMGEQARTMAAVPHAGIASDADLRELAAAADGMSEAGDLVARIASQVLASVSQSQRWIGVWR